MSELDGRTLDIEKENINNLKELFPEIDTDGKIDFDKLKELLGEYVDDSEERYKFTWNGKGEALRLSQTPSMGTLRPAPEEGESKNWDETENLYIEGDNLEVLKLLQKSYFGKIKMIYIDPPYNTGNDFVYPDNYKDNIKNYKKITGQADKEGKATTTNPEYSGRYHTDWLNMMYPRLRLARNLLTDNGVIFISIDDNEVHNLRKICDEIFGEDNFVTNIIWQKRFSRSNDAEYFSEMHDNILCYRKGENEKWEISLLPRKDKIPKGYSNPDDDSRGLWTSVILSAKSGSESLNYKITGPTGREFYPPSGRYWSVSKESYKKLLEDKRIWFGVNGNGIPRRKTFLSEVQNGLTPNTIWFYDEVGHNQEGRQEVKKLFDDKGVFDGPKPIRLLKTLLKISTNKEDLILDFFAGSSTTAHAVMDLNAEDNGNRKHIMVQLPEPTDKKSEAHKAGYKNISEIGKERIRRAGDKIKLELEEKYEQASEEERKDMKNPEKLDIGFKVFKLDSSNIKEWNPGKYDDIQMAIEDSMNPYVEGRTEEDVVYEMILKMGLDLTAPVEKYEVNGKTIYSIGFGYLMICLSDNIDLSIAQKMIKIKDQNNQTEFRTIFRDEGFNSDTDKTNIKETLKSAGLAEESFITL